MAAPLILAAERANEFALVIEDEDRWVIFEFLTAFVNDVNAVLGIDGDVVRGLPRVLAREFDVMVLFQRSLFEGLVLDY